MWERFIVGSLSIPVIALGYVSQMSRLRQVKRQMLIYLSALTRGILFNGLNEII